MREIHEALWGYEEWLYRQNGILIKKICAEKRLSVQVHPNELTAKTVGGDPKTEMWCVMKEGPIFAGFRSGVTATDVKRAVSDGRFESLMVRFDAKPGECYFIPGGLVHAIGEGTSVYEVQQASETTFRLYDWDRVDAQGKPRQLHVTQALAAMDIALPPPVPQNAVECPYFSFRQVSEGGLDPTVKGQVVYLPSADKLMFVEPGALQEITAPAFVTAFDLV